MDLGKRRASEDGGQPIAKVARIQGSDSGHDQVKEVPGPSSLHNNPEDFEVEVKLRSTSKAARNDPRPTLSDQELYRKLILKRGPDTVADTGALHKPGGGANPAHDTDDCSEQEETTHDNDDAGSPDRDDLLEKAAVSTGAGIRIGTRIDAEESQQDGGTISSEDGEGDEGYEYDSDIDEDSDGDEYEVDDDCSEFDDDFELKWLEPIDVQVSHTSSLDEYGKPRVVAYCRAKLIRRSQMRYDFYGEMEPPSRETSMLAFHLFDRYGRLRTEFKTHPVIKGSGVWGQELDQGDILLIEELFVNREYRRQGLGRRMIESLSDLARLKTRSFFAFVWPTLSEVHDLRREWENLPNDEARSQMADREHERAVMFYRSLGFRRVGSSIWFAMSPSNDHPSLQVASTEDYNPPNASPSALDSLLSPFQEISDPPPTAVDRIFNLQPPQDPDLLGVLRNCLQQKGSADACWTGKDKYGNTVLHLVASIFNVPSVEWVVTQEFGTKLLHLRNNKGETPLELLQFKLEKLRTQRVINQLTIPISDQFEGHSDSAVRCLILLKTQRSLESFVESQGPEALLQTIGGCTCGQCLKGFLSPRMSRALLTQARIENDNMNDEIHTLSGPLWVECYGRCLGYLPARVMTNLKTNKSMRQGFTNLWTHIATCLATGEVPDESNVLDVVEGAGEWPPHTMNFLERGGTVQSAFLAICRAAMSEDEWIGDGQYQGCFSRAIAELPECRNDLEFGYVSGMCGYRRISLVENVDLVGNHLDEDGELVATLL